MTLISWVGGVLPLLLEFLDGITWKIGHTSVSVRTLIEGALTAGTLMLLALWSSALLEARLMRSASATSFSLRKVIANSVRSFMVFVSLLLLSFLKKAKNRYQDCQVVCRRGRIYAICNLRGMQVEPAP